MYKVRRIDKNQPEIVKRFRQHGCTVCILSAVGNGVPDILVSKLVSQRNRAQIDRWTALIEIKDGSKPPSARKLTTEEQAFHDTWQGEIHIIGSMKEVDDLITAL